MTLIISLAALAVAVGVLAVLLKMSRDVERLEDDLLRRDAGVSEVWRALMAAKVEKIDPQPGETVIISVDETISARTAESIREAWAQAFPGVQGVVVGKGIEVEV